MLETKTNFGGTAYHWVSEMCADVHDWWAGMVDMMMLAVQRVQDGATIKLKNICKV